MDKSAVRLENVSKSFGPVTAVNRVSLELRRGEILSLLGENGSGKTTLMNMLAGLYFPDEGEIFVDGQPVTIRSPRDALSLGIGMVHQHFKLVDVFTAAENIVLGTGGSGRYDAKRLRQDILDISQKYGFEIDPDRKIYDMSVSERQTVEIVKVLYRGAKILILDEPTAVLTPQETDKLFAVLRSMREDGKSVVIITHKLNEVMAVSDRVAVLRRGKYIGDVATRETDPKKLTEMMVGRSISLNIDRPEPTQRTERLRVSSLSVLGEDGVMKLKDVSFEAYSGELLGIAGISGSGQKELLEAIAGLDPAQPGASVLFTSREGEAHELVGKSPLEIAALGVALSFVPEDRLGMGLVGDMDITDNMLLRSYKRGKSFITDRRRPKKLAEEVVDELEVATPRLSLPVRRLSGGNVQKVLVGREIAMQPTVLMTAYAVRGLDINTSYTIYNLLTEQKMKGVCVIYVGEDLDVLLELCDRIMVICDGQVSGVLDGRTATKEQLGLLMTHMEVSAGE
ncbi:MAG: ABC transporter ATP-binding protein [Oscillospiraceae bacterium]|jgi:simple sugar transport system ATP-binding protein|nr:ABC transporter ATP-binding protein [Oscillospiraceae bacterium]